MTKQRLTKCKECECKTSTTTHFERGAGRIRTVFKCANCGAVKIQGKWLPDPTPSPC